MTYRELQKRISNFSSEQLDLEVLVNVDGNDNDNVGPFYEAEFTLGDTSSNDNPYFVISGCEEDRISIPKLWK